jgi:hypothetical protein
MRDLTWRSVAAALLASSMALASCAAGPDAGAFAAGGLNPSWRASRAVVPLRGSAGPEVSVAVAPWSDQRPGAPGRRLGEVQAAVFGLHERELRLARDATAVIADAVREELQAQGLTVLAAPDGAEPRLDGRAGLRLEGSVVALTLNVAGRDERHIALQATLRRQADGKILWSGTADERDDRFAGVSGNSRADLELYLGEGIAKAAARLALAVREHAGLPATVAAPAALVVPAAAPVAGAFGQVLVTTRPARAKVYVDDVYQGLSPITLELPTGTNQLHVKLDGHRAASEKVAVRRGTTVELELKLEPL